MADELSLEDETLFEASPAVGGVGETMFDQAIACLEDVVMSASFRQPVIDFCRASCMLFIPGVEENTLEQYALFEKYEQLTEAKIASELAARVPGFDLAVFEAMLVQPGRAEIINSDIIDMLMTFGDFEEFKQTMLSYREQVEFEGTTGTTRSLAIDSSHGGSAASCSGKIVYREVHNAPFQL
jgi:hypothetical protein